jgi:uncharacterized membrane protein HdeD (DUF308 family)
MNISRLITGIVMIAGGLFLIGLSFFIDESFWVALMYGIPLLIIGIFILLNKKEDKIEQIKQIGGKK